MELMIILVKLAEWELILLRKLMNVFGAMKLVLFITICMLTTTLVHLFTLLENSKLKNSLKWVSIISKIFVIPPVTCNACFNHIHL